MLEVVMQTMEPGWTAPPGVQAALTLRVGGASVGPHSSLNVGTHVGDSSQRVRDNRALLREYLLLPSEPVWLEQVHGVDVADLDVLGARDVASVDAGVDRRASGEVASGRAGAGLGAGGEPASVSGALRADAAVTRTAGRVCVIQVADCMPVLFAARDGSAVGAAHAGWRGLAGGVLEATVRQLGVAPGELLAWLGPAISQKAFEVGDDVRTAFVSQDPAAASAFEANARGRWQCDLYALARRRLATLGVRDVSGGGWCTFADPDRFFSYRRDGQCGRMAALIWMTPRA